MSVLSLIERYARWLHTQWPAGTVEPLPQIGANGATSVPGLFVTGDLTGIPLLKFAADSGARTVRAILAEPDFQRLRQAAGDAGDPASAAGLLDLIIIGAGVSGIAAAAEAARAGLRFEILEAAEPLSTLSNFPRAKPIFTYPTQMTPAGDLQFSEKTSVKEGLVSELRAFMDRHGIVPRAARAESVVRAPGTAGALEVRLHDGGALRARRVIIAIGRSGNFRRLGVPGEDLDKVYNRLHDPRDFAGRRVAVVGGGDAALETAGALARCGSDVTLIHRGSDFTRAKDENIALVAALVHHEEGIAASPPPGEAAPAPAGSWLDAGRAPGHLTLMMPATLAEIRETEIDVRDGAGRVHTLPNDVVFSMIGREPPLDFLRRSGVSLRGESSGRRTLWTLLLILAMAAVCDWKSEGFISRQLSALGRADAFPRNMPAVLSGLGEWWSAQLAERRTLLGTLAVSMTSRSFYFTLLYTIVLAVFGWKRIRRRRTPYVTVQTITLFLVQLFPLFLLPELILPWLGYNEVFSTGPGQAIADSLFERTVPEADDVAGRWPEFGHPRAYWRAYGLILAWPLMVHNIFTPRPMWAWIAIGVLQTFVVIPWMIRRWGKGAYCGWICSCGGLAETAGDTLRERMPHGPRWNRLNMAGQAILAAAFLLLAVRIAGWLVPGTWMDGVFYFLFEGTGAGGRLLNPLSWKWTVDVLLASILGVGLYLSYSGRVWCRFFCPLAALMHVYARFSRFRIAADKKKCISCNVCTAVCHQGIDVMSFANKGLPMADPQCVRCSACVHSCPTAVLEFVQINTRNGQVVRREKLAASPVRMKESVLSTEH